MVFKELEIQGFKSFPDKVKITFDEGVTGVVGPNGSGKSNLSDAVRWVLGETSARQLRAAGKMEDVIFGGTRRRGAMGFAQVRLTLDNSSHALDVEADEVTIGRRYYRSGESEYSINGQICRLKDVYELLLDTGIGRDGYSVIGQGRIAEIVAAKSSERREIFEEACGIAKYRYRKNEAMHHPERIDDFCKSDDDFHELLMSTLPNKYLRSGYDRITGLNTRFRIMTGKVSMINQDQTCEEHLEILNAALSDNWNTAADALQHHLELARDKAEGVIKVIRLW